MTTMLLRNKHMLGLDRSETLHFTYNCTQNESWMFCGEGDTRCFGVYRVCIPKDPHAPVRGNTVSAGGYSYSKEAVSQRLGARCGARQMRSAFTGCLGAVAHKLASVSIVPSWAVTQKK